MASEFGGWQARMLRWLKQHYDEATNSFAKEASSGAIDEVCSVPALISHQLGCALLTRIACPARARYAREVLTSEL